VSSRTIELVRSPVALWEQGWTTAGQRRGFRDWRLPSIDELQHLVGPSANSSGYRITGPIKLTGWQWSSTPGTEKGEAWALDFGDGGRASVVAGDSGLNRALCIALPKKAE
jgi:hypothetical protein